MERKKAKMNLKKEKIGSEDLLIEILLRVPAKSLVRFKCVSKQWLSLISDQTFCYNHSARNPNVTSAIYYYSDPDCSRLKSLSLKGRQNLPPLPLLDGVEDNDTISVVHACNGLMLCSQKSWWWLKEYICICNLTTNKYIVLLQGPRSSNPILFACISYDPAKSPYYKVVLTREPNLIDIYFSENNSWKRIQVIEKLRQPRHVAFWEGSIHWIHSRKTHLKFDVDKETLTTISLPSKLSFLKDELIHYFGECGENLILIQYQPRVITEKFTILEMKRGTTYWTKKQEANLRLITKLFPQHKEFHVLSVLKGSVENDVVLILGSDYKIFKYNLRIKTLEVISDLGHDAFWSLEYHRHYCSSIVFHFIESLVPV